MPITAPHPGTLPRNVCCQRCGEPMWGITTTRIRMWCFDCGGTAIEWLLEPKVKAA